MNIKPLYDRVLVKRTAHEETTSTGIFLPDSAKEKTQTGQVLAVGTGKILADGSVQKFKVKVGDLVFLPKYAGTEIEEDHIILLEGEILGIVEQ